MTDAPDGPVLDFLRERFGRLDATLAEMRTEQRARIGAIKR